MSFYVLQEIMSQNDDETLEDAELIEGLFENDAKVVLADFSGRTASSLRRFLADRGDSMDLMFSYSIISGKGFAYFLPSINDYARSPESGSDCGLPGPFVHAIKNQLRINPAAIFTVRDQVESLSEYLLAHLAKFDLDDEEECETSHEFEAILEILRRNKTAEQDAPSNRKEPPC